MASLGDLQCPYEGCYQRFKTERDLRKHKMRENDHEYCAKCNLDFDDWQGLVDHKASSPSSKHITCGKCGMDFGSLSGRERHIRQNHPLDQNIECTACHERFFRAAALVYHLESSSCNNITASTFNSFVRHKQNARDVFNDETVAKAESKGAYIEAAKDEEVGGGVSLNLLDDTVAEAGLVKALAPLQVQDNNVAPKEERFPTLPSGPDSKKHEQQFIPGAGPLIWNKGTSSQVLFPDAKPIPVLPGSRWDNKIEGKKIEQDNASLLTYGVLDPRSPDFDADRFKHPLTDDYECPFPLCSYETKCSLEITNHILVQHDLEKPQCPCCLKYFRSIHQLVAHVESSEKCSIRKSKKFTPWLSSITGGFLSAETRLRSDVAFRIEIEREDGTMQEKKLKMAYTQYQGTVPEEMERVQEENEVSSRHYHVTGC